MYAEKSMEQILNESRSLAGTPPRTVPFLKRNFVKMPIPRWVQQTKDPRFTKIFSFQGKLFRYGNIVWGAIVQANNLLFSEGESDCPAAILYSLDSGIDSNTDILESACHELFSVKGEDLDDPEMQRFSDMLEDEMEINLKLNVPKRLTGGIQCFYSSIMVHRNHLPNNILSKGLFPLLVYPEKTEATMILPCQFWSAAFIEYWLSN